MSADPAPNLEPGPASAPAEPVVSTRRKGADPATAKRTSWLTFALIALGVVLTVLFGLRALRSFSHFRDMRARPPMAAISGVRPWMTLGMVADLFNVDEAELYAEMLVPQEGNQKRSLIELTQRYARDDRAEFRHRLERAITKLTMPPPPQGPPQPDVLPEPPAPDDPPPATPAAPSTPVAEGAP